MIRIAAVGDVHFDRHSRGRLSKYFQYLEGKADVLLLAGDLTQVGHVEEGRALAADLAESPVPVIAIFGNHDYHLQQDQEIRGALEQAGTVVLERAVAELEVSGVTLGVVGLKGFGGGFIGACASDFGEIEMKNFVRHTQIQSQFIRDALAALQSDYRVVLLHYSPIAETLYGEKREIYPFLGSYLLGEAVDDGRADMVFHGHAHRGVEKGNTPGGIPVRNVAQPVIRHVFNIYTLDKHQGILSSPIHVPHAVGKHMNSND